MSRRIFGTDRTANLEPVLVPGRNKPWRLSIPPKFSPNGKRRQLFFDTKDEALQEAKQCRGHHGDLLTGLSPHDLSEAVRALDLLRPHGIGLLEATTTFLDDLKSRQNSRSFGAIFEAYRVATSRKSPSHLENVRQTETMVRNIFDRPIGDVTAHDIESVFAGCSPATFDKRVSLLRSVLTYAERKGWSQSNVATQIDKRAASAHAEVETYSIDEVRRILRYCLEHDRESLPYMAICFFTGLRPEVEAARLEWSSVHLDGSPEIVVSAGLSKTNQRRFVPVPDNCIAWIRASGSTIHGRVFPLSESTKIRKRSAMIQATGIRWIKDGARHTFCSAWLAKHKNVDRLREISGHTDTRTLFKHYNRSMRVSDAEEFFSVAP
jgi:integrase